MNTQNLGHEPVPLERMGFWQSLKLAIQGSEADYTKISLNRAIFLLAIPMVLELLMESTFAVANISVCWQNMCVFMGKSCWKLYRLLSVALASRW